MRPDDEYSRVEAIWALAGEASPETDELLLDWTLDSNPQVRKAALSVLGDRLDSEYEPIFLAALYDEDESVQQVAASYLMMFSDDRSRLAAVRFFGKTNPSGYFSQLMSALRDECCMVRDAAAQFLKKLSDEERVGQLLALARDPSEGTEGRRTAIKVLGNSDRTDVIDGLGSLLADEEVGREAGAALGNTATGYAGDMLLAALSGADRKTRLSAAIGIRSNGDFRALPPLCRMLESNDSTLERIIAAGALASIAEKLRSKGRLSTTAVDDGKTFLSIAFVPLTAACRDEDADVRQEALRALGATGAPEAFGYVLAALQDESNLVFYSAADAAASLKMTQVLDMFLKMFEGDLPDDYDSRLSSAIHFLGKLGDERATPFLMRCADSTYLGTKIQAAQALLAVGNASRWDILDQALRDRENDWTCYSRADVARTVAGSGDPRAVDLLLEVLEGIDLAYEPDEHLLEALIESLGTIRDPRVLEAIRKWQHHEFENHEDLVGEALRKFEGSKARGDEVS